MATKYCNPDLASGDNDGTSEANAYQDLSTAIASISGGDLLYVKKTSSRHDDGVLDFATGINGSATTMTIIEGYGSTPGDNIKFEYAERFDVDARSIVFRNFDIEFSAGADGVLQVDSNADNVHIHNCRLYNTQTGNYPAVYVNQTAIITNCEIISDGNITTPASGAVRITGGDQLIIDGCSIRGSKGIGAIPGGRGISITNCIFYDAPNRNMTKGIEIDLQNSASEVKTCTISHNTVYHANNAGIDFRELPIFDEDSAVLVSNNIFWGDGGGSGIKNTDSTTTVGPVFINNAMGNWGGDSNHMTGFGATNDVYGTIDLTADPFVDGDNGDFRLNGTAGGGAACRSAAHPTTFPGLSFTNKRDIGAVGHTGLLEKVSVS